MGRDLACLVGNKVLAQAFVELGLVYGKLEQRDAGGKRGVVFARRAAPHGSIRNAQHSGKIGDDITIQKTAAVVYAHGYGIRPKDLLQALDAGSVITYQHALLGIGILCKAYALLARLDKLRPQRLHVEVLTTQVKHDLDVFCANAQRRAAHSLPKALLSAVVPQAFVREHERFIA